MATLAPLLLQDLANRYYSLKELFRDNSNPLLLLLK